MPCLALRFQIGSWTLFTDAINSNIIAAVYTDRTSSIRISNCLYFLNVTPTSYRSGVHRFTWYHKLIVDHLRTNILCFFNLGIWSAVSVTSDFASYSSVYYKSWQFCSSFACIAFAHRVLKPRALNYPWPGLVGTLNIII